MSLGGSGTWDCNTGLLTSATDENSKQTSFAYDAFFRSTQVNLADGGHTSWAYNDTSSNVVTTTALASGSNRVDTAELDGLGRVTQSQLNSDPAGADYVDTTYDALGRIETVSNPHRPSSPLPSDGTTTLSYDALSRLTSVQHADSNTAQVFMVPQ